MLTIHTRGRDGHVIHTRCFCEQCEPLELAERLIAKVERGKPATVKLGRLLREELHHGDEAMPPWCDRCGTPRLE